MKVFREIFNSILLAIIVTGAITVISKEIIKRNDGMVYTKIMGNLLIYPRPDEPMTCEVYKYLQENKE